MSVLYPLTTFTSWTARWTEQMTKSSFVYLTATVTVNRWIRCGRRSKCSVHVQLKTRVQLVSFGIRNGRGTMFYRRVNSSHDRLSVENTQGSYRFDEFYSTARSTIPYRWSQPTMSHRSITPSGTNWLFGNKNSFENNLFSYGAGRNVYKI